MDNGNMPAFAQSNKQIVAAFLQVESRAPNGLTKREYFAGLAMQGIASDSEFQGTLNDAVVLSITYADALLAELENNNEY